MQREDQNHTGTQMTSIGRQCSKLLLYLLPFQLLAQDYSSMQHQDAQYNQALRLHGKQQDQQAIKQLHQILQLNPHHVRAWQKLVELYGDHNDLDSCLGLMDSLRRQDPQNPFGYYGLGLCYKSKKNLREAGICFEHLLQLAPVFPGAYKELFDVMDDSAKQARAIDAFKGALRANSANYAACYGLGYAYQSQNNRDKALEFFNQAIKLKPDLLDAYKAKSVILFNSGKYQELLQTSDTGLAFAQKLNDLEYQCLFLGNTGLGYYNLANYPQAIEYVNQALGIAREIGARSEEARNLGNLGAIYKDKARYKEALGYFADALKIAQQINDTRRIGLFYRNIGAVHGSLGQYALALEYYHKALPLLISTGDKNLQSLTLWSIGWIYRAYDDFSKAFEYDQQALKIAAESGDKWGQARYLGSTGLVYWRQGNFSKALEFYERALAIAREIGDRNEQARQYGNIAIVFYEIGDYSKSLDYYDQALRMTREIGDRSEEARNLGNMGDLYITLEDFDNAAHLYQQAVQIVREIGEKYHEAWFLGCLGKIAIKTGNYDSANQLIRQGLQIAREIKSLNCETMLDIQLADLNLEMKDYEGSFQVFTKILERSKNANDPMREIQAHYGLAILAEKKKQPQDALRHYLQAIDKIDEVRQYMSSEEAKAGFLENWIQVYESTIQLLATLHRDYPSDGYDKRAFEVAEKARARALLDIVYQGKIFHNLTEIPDEFRQQFLLNESDLAKAYASVAVDKAKTAIEDNGVVADSMSSKIHTLESRKAELLKELYKKYPRYYQLTNPELLTARQVQTTVLDENQVLIEYFVGDERLYCWTISKKAMHFSTIELGKKHLAELLAKASPVFAEDKKPPAEALDHRWANMNPEYLHVLYEHLLGNVASPFIKPGDELIIIPDDILYYFPFEVLIAQKNRYLIEEHPVSYGLSASLLNPALGKRKKASGDLLAFGNPAFSQGRANAISKWIDDIAAMRSIFRGDSFVPLPSTETEVREIAGNFAHAAVFVGKEATESHFKQSAENYRYIHLATHHVIDDKQPMYSKIILAQQNDGNEDGLLQTYEIYNFHLNAEMVVLSGCNSGLGKLHRGEGLIGMTQAFFYAGVPSIVVSLWPVEDESTAYLMKQFYLNLKTGMSKKLALQKAKAELVRSADWRRDPFYWAPFILIGDWN
jgi:CHAT domain-containing protein/tetratricopeptide (TPR) repeat protein